jgi:hypothetical protein
MHLMTLYDPHTRPSKASIHLLILFPAQAASWHVLGVLPDMQHLLLPVPVKSGYQAVHSSSVGHKRVQGSGAAHSNAEGAMSVVKGGGGGGGEWWWCGGGGGGLCIH